MTAEDEHDPYARLFAEWNENHTPCEDPEHHKSTGGCNADEPGSYAAEILHHVGVCTLAKLDMPHHVIVICRSKAIWYQARRDSTITCPACHRTMTLGDAFRVLGELATASTSTKGTA